MINAVCREIKGNDVLLPVVSGFSKAVAQLWQQRKYVANTKQLSQQGWCSANTIVASQCRSGEESQRCSWSRKLPVGAHASLFELVIGCSIGEGAVDCLQPISFELRVAVKNSRKMSCCLGRSGVGSLALRT